MANTNQNSTDQAALPPTDQGSDASAAVAAASAEGSPVDAAAPAAGHGAMSGSAPLAEYTGDVGSIAGFLPDTPWTTTAVHACERRRARVWVDSIDMPQQVAVVVPGDPDRGVAPEAYLFGSEADPGSLIRFVSDFSGDLDVVCDDSVGEILAEALPTLVPVEHAIRWFERLDSVERPEMQGLRRLRLRDEEEIQKLGVTGLLRSFETLKDVLMIGGASGIVVDGKILAAAFTVDQSVNYARIRAFTAEPHRQRHLATAAVRHIVAAHHEQGRLACALIRADSASATGLGRTTGFDAAARVTIFQKR
jgi:hypothetical protein